MGRSAGMVLTGLLLVLTGGAQVGLGAAGSPALLTSNGSVLVRDGTLVTPYPLEGRWVEGESKSTGRWEAREFRYLASPKPPPIELVVAFDKQGDPPDGSFETGVVKGYLSSFAARAGLSVGGVFFDNRPIGPASPRHALVKLYSDKVTAWAHVYIFVRSPSLTFISFRPGEDASEIERYLTSLGIGTR